MVDMTVYYIKKIGKFEFDIQFWNPIGFGQLGLEWYGFSDLKSYGITVLFGFGSMGIEYWKEG